MATDSVLIRATRPDGSHVTLRLTLEQFEHLKYARPWHGTTRLGRIWTEDGQLPWPPSPGSWEVVP